MSMSISRSLVLEIGQAFRSMKELAPVLNSVLKQMQVAVSCDGALIWLLNDSESEVE